MKYQPKIHIRRLNRDHYLIPKTGEVKLYSHSRTRAENVANVRKSLAQLRDLLNANVTDVSRAKWVTLTYSQPQNNLQALTKDMGRFIARLHYWMENHEFPRFEYISAIEPGKQGFHIHLVLIFQQTAPFIANTLMEKTWGHGFTKVKKLDNINNLGLYLTAILSDLDTESLEDEGDIPKSVIKGGRLSLYPTGCRIYRRSRGTFNPTVRDCTYAEALQEVGDAKLTFERSVEVLYDAGNIVNVIGYWHYQRHPKGGGD